MKPAALFERLLDAIDLAYGAAGALWRVLARGAFAPDAKSRRGARYSSLPSDIVLVQDIALNARDEVEARKAVALDPERRLPLAPEAVYFDVVGPVSDGARPRGRPERTFLLGVVRKDALARLREGTAKHGAAHIEAFVFTAPAHPQWAFSFVDAPGRRRRRLRRSLTAIAVMTFGVAALDLNTAWHGALEAALVEIETERMSAERRVRLGERAAREAAAALAAPQEAPAPLLAEVQEDLDRLAFRLPPHSELTGLVTERGGLRLIGRTHESALLELELRRIFEGRAISFRAEPGESAEVFEAFVADEVEGRAAP